MAVPRQCRARPPQHCADHCAEYAAGPEAAWSRISRSRRTGWVGHGLVLALGLAGRAAAAAGGRIAAAAAVCIAAAVVCIAAAALEGIAAVLADIAAAVEGRPG